jgi:flagellar basal body-associated protein FliL
MKKQNGCLTAFLIVLGIIVVVGLIHLGVAYYFMTKKFELKEVKANEPAAMADTSASVSE